jgi:hypothetical protein
MRGRLNLTGFFPRSLLYYNSSTTILTSVIPTFPLHSLADTYQFKSSVISRTPVAMEAHVHTLATERTERWAWTGKDMSIMYYEG